MLSVANFFQTIGFYGFANWVPTLLIAKGIHVSQTLEYAFIIAFAYPIFPLVSTLFADRIERKWQVCLSCLGIAVFGILFSFQTDAGPLIIIGTLQTMMNAWLSFSAHNYQAGTVSHTHPRPRGRLCLFLEPVQHDLHRLLHRRHPAVIRRAGRVYVRRECHGDRDPVGWDLGTAHESPLAGGNLVPPTRDTAGLTTTKANRAAGGAPSGRSFCVIRRLD